MSSPAGGAFPGPEQQDAPLSEAERKLLARLFSDPTYFPIEFRTWIRTYLESSDIRLPASAVVGGNVPKINMPAGVILPYAGGTPPANVLPCIGQDVSRAEFALLYAVIGDAWGDGDGSTTFGIPDLRDRALFGAGSTVGLASTDGAPVGSRGGPRHHHYFSDSGSISGNTGGGGGHSHSVPGVGTTDLIQEGTAGGVVTVLVPGGSLGTTGVSDHSHPQSGSASVADQTSGGYLQDLPSYAGINWVIATGKPI